MKKDYSKQLEEFAKKLKNIPEIIAVYYTGSTATEKWDECSDIDIDVVVENENLKKVYKKIPSLFKYWGEVKFWGRYPYGDETYAHVGDNYLKVEINILRLSTLNQDLKSNKEIKIAFDKRNIIKKSGKSKIKINHNEFVNDFLFLRDWHLYVAKHWKRGQKFSAKTEVYSIKYDLFRLLSKIKNREEHELIRNAEKELTKTKRDFFVVNTSNIKKELEKTWKFMKHIEKEYEKTFNKKLNMKCNDKEIKQKIRDFLK
jgi:predicted nucleotidyltransferase